MRAIVYCRVSTDAQEREGTSLQTQEEACRHYANARGYTIVAVERDTLSGAVLERSGLGRLRELIRTRRADVLVAYSLDRLSRSQNHIGILDDECQRHGARLEFVTERFEDTPIGRFIRAARSFTDELEREKFAERAARGKGKRAGEGRLVQGTGRGIYGYRYAARGRGGDGRRSVDEPQAVVVRRIFATFVGGASVHAIAADLNRDSITSLTGAAWPPLTVRRILQNEAYSGRTIYRRTRVERSIDATTGRRRQRVIERPSSDWIEIEGVTPAIITREVWEQAQTILADPPHRARRGRAIHPYPLSGRIRCDACEGPLAGSALSGGQGRTRIRYYGCRNRNLADRTARCPSRYVRAAELESRLVTALRRVLANPLQIVTAYNALQASTQRPDTEACNDAHRRIEDADAQLARLARAIRLAEDDAVTDALARQMNAASHAKRAAEAELERLSNQSPTPQLAVENPAVLAELSTRVANWLDPEDQEKMRMVLEGLEITVWAGANAPRATGTLPVPATCEPRSHADVRAMVTKSWATTPLVGGGSSGTTPSIRTLSVDAVMRT
jgi:site-specific DNA recombinase